MMIQMEVEDRNVPFVLDWDNWCWESSEDLMESDFPLIIEVDNKRYELFSDETFAEVE